MNIGELEDVRTITLHPLTGIPELTHPSDIEGLIASYGVVRLIGVVGKTRSECLTLRGPFVNESVQVKVVEECVYTLSPELRRSLCIEYRELISDS
jgi:hypothetical protein